MTAEGRIFSSLLVVWKCSEILSLVFGILLKPTLRYFKGHFIFICMNLMLSASLTSMYHKLHVSYYRFPVTTESSCLDIIAGGKLTFYLNYKGHMFSCTSTAYCPHAENTSHSAWIRHTADFYQCTGYLKKNETWENKNKRRMPEKQAVILARSPSYRSNDMGGSWGLHHDQA